MRKTLAEAAGVGTRRHRVRCCRSCRRGVPEVHTTRLVTEPTVTDKLTGELRIMQLSDIHMRDDPAQLASIVA